MKMLFIYPPEAYEFMPYLATPLLKGYIEENSNHKVSQIDLNIAFYEYIWSSEAAIDCINVIEKQNSDDAKRTYYHSLATVLKDKIYKSYKALKNYKTYQSVKQIEHHMKILNSMKDLIKYVNIINAGNSSALPKKIGGFETLLNMFEKSVLGIWLKKNVPMELLNYDIIGFSISYKEQLVPAIFLSKIIKKMYPNVKIVFGGNTVTHYKQELLTDTSIREIIDFAIFYEGEYPLLRLMTLLENKDYEGIKLEENIASFNQYEVIYNENLSSKPKVQATPNFEGISLDSFPTPEPIMPLLTSKGCYWGKCTYCAHFEGYGQGFYSYNEDIVIDTIKSVQEKHLTNYFYIVDEALPPKTVHNLAEKLQDNNINIRWFSEARAENAFTTAKSLQSLRDSGCILLINGIESGNDDVLKMMAKGLKVKTIEKYLEYCKAAGIGTAGMFFIGFPGETEEQAEDTFKFIERNQDNIDFASVGVFFMERDTPVYLNPDFFNIEKIINSKKDYPLSYEYKMNNSEEIYNPQTIKPILSSLHNKYAHLRTKFVKAIDRSLMIFIKENNGYNDNDIIIPEKEEIVITVGKYKGKKGILDIYSKKLEVQESR